MEVMCLSVACISLALCMRSMLLLNLFDEKQLIESVDRSNALFLIIISLVVIVLCIVMVMMISRSLGGKVVLTALCILLLTGAACYLGNKNLNGANLYDA